MANSREESTHLQQLSQFRNTVERERKRDGEACDMLFSSGPQFPDNISKKDIDRALRKWDQKAAAAPKEIAGSAKAVYEAALGVDTFRLPDGKGGTLSSSLSPQGMLEVLDTGLVPNAALPAGLTNQQAKAVLAKGGQDAINLALDFSDNMNNFSVSAAVKHSAAEQAITEVCNALPPPSEAERSGHGLPYGQRPEGRGTRR